MEILAMLCAFGCLPEGRPALRGSEILEGLRGDLLLEFIFSFGHPGNADNNDGNYNFKFV